MLCPQRRIDELDISTALRDRIAEEEDAFFFRQFPGEEAGDDKEGEEEMTHGWKIQMPVISRRGTPLSVTRRGRWIGSRNSWFG